MKQLILSLFLLSATALNAQVGVNTNDPKTTLDVVGTPSDATIPDGIIAPRISREKLILKTSYTTAQTGAIVYVSDLSGTTNTATAKVTAIGYYYFNGTVWNSMNASVSQFSYGDIKTGVQTADHQGWVKLDGRATTSLTSTQQAQATALGFGANLPDATNSVLMQNGTALGSVAGSNAKTISQANLPNVNLTADGISAGTPSGTISVANTTSTMNTDGEHSHTLHRRSNPDSGAFDTSDARKNEGSVATTDRHLYTNAVTTSSSGFHTHTMNAHNHMATFTGTAMGTHAHTVPLGGSNTPLDITPRSLSVNTFIYLGE